MPGPLSNIAFAAGGGALGSVARYWLLQEAGDATDQLRSIALSAVVGCFALGLVLGGRGLARADTIRALSIGLCGGFSSFSLYAVFAVSSPISRFAMMFTALTPPCALGAMALGLFISRHRRML
ncbi:CrcB family protein [Actinomycetes bacterium M1A6_2h]